MLALASSDAPSQDATSDSASTRIQRRPVDPASPNYEGREAVEWDALRPSERVERAEQAIAAALDDGADLERAWLILSTARADFFASDAGARRYLELEQALLDAGPE